MSMSIKDITQLKVDMQQIKDDIKYTRQDVAELKKEVCDWMEKADVKYAQKWVEIDVGKIKNWILAVVGTGVIAMGLYLIKLISEHKLF